jgi:hypothetical protein
MIPNPPLRIPQHLETAVQRVRMAARAAAERTSDSLGRAALATHNVFQRDALLAAQYELNRKLAIYSLTFNDNLDKRVARETAPREPGQAVLHTDWAALSLVEDREVENQVSAERFALQIQHECEWEVRELDGYICAMLGLARPQHDRNPLRPELVGMAMLRAIDAITTDRPETRKTLATELGRALATAMRQTYIDIVQDLKAAGVRPAELAVRSGDGPGFRSGRYESGYDRLHETSGGGLRSPTTSGAGTSTGGFGTSTGSFATGNRGDDGWRPVRGSPVHGTPMGSVDVHLMALMRSLSRQALRDTGGDSGGSGWSASSGSDRPDLGSGMGSAPAGFDTGEPRQPVAPNIIALHRDALRRAASGALDHMVIDVVGSLFDQILSDPKVPPQMARQIARLQLPVLRAALGDPTFFSSRRHPVRRFVNRIASLGCAFDDFEDEDARSFLALVKELVQHVVEGDFDQIEVYEHKLAALERFIADMARREVHARGHADELLARKESELRTQRHYAVHLQAALEQVPVDDFLRRFVAEVWSRVVLHDSQHGGADGQAAARARQVGRDLVMSVQPKGTPQARKSFLVSLPQLMKDLNAGMDRVRLPDGARRDFFAKLLPAHAESLKGQTMRTLDFNLLACEIDQILSAPPPDATHLPPIAQDERVQLQQAANAPAFSAEEATAIGLIDEASFDWNGKVDIEVGAEPEVTTVDIEIDGLPVPEPVEPSRGKSLADHVQIGFAYQMHLEGEWHKVRLMHMSPGRTFFVFTHGRKHKRTISMTHRMLERLCETGRMRAFESGYLIERATARARRQLSRLGTQPSGAAA